MMRFWTIAIVCAFLLIGCDSVDNDLPLIGTQWVVYQSTSTVSGEVVSSFADGEETRLIFKESGRVVIEGRFGKGAAAYTISEGQPTISDWICFGSSLFYCPDILLRATEWSVRGDELQVIIPSRMTAYSHRALPTTSGN